MVKKVSRFRWHSKLALMWLPMLICLTENIGYPDLAFATIMSLMVDWIYRYSDLILDYLGWGLGFIFEFIGAICQWVSRWVAPFRVHFYKLFWLWASPSWTDIHQSIWPQKCNLHSSSFADMLGSHFLAP